MTNKQTIEIYIYTQKFNEANEKEVRKTNAEENKK